MIAQYWRILKVSEFFSSNSSSMSRFSPSQWPFELVRNRNRYLTLILRLVDLCNIVIVLVQVQKSHRTGPVLSESALQARGCRSRITIRLALKCRIESR